MDRKLKLHMDIRMYVPERYENMYEKNGNAVQLQYVQL
jgi:hypothetical protein